MSKKARAVLALDVAGAHRRGVVGSKQTALEVVAALATAAPAPMPEPGLGISLLGSSDDPVETLLGCYDHLVEIYGSDAAHEMLEVLARLAAAALRQLAAERGRDAGSLADQLAAQEFAGT